MTLRIELLGRFSLTLDGAPVSEATRARVQDLLAWLILHRAAPSPRRVVASALWPDVRDEQALKNLRTLLTRAHECLPILDHYLLITDQVVQLRVADGWHADAAEFEDDCARGLALLRCDQVQEAASCFARACAAYCGDLLPDHNGQWLEEERNRLRQLWIDALNRWWLLLFQEGDYTSALSVAQRIVVADPYCERAYVLLMRTQLALGDRAGAVRTYHLCAQLLRRDLGIDPGSETQQAYEVALFEDSALQGSREGIKLIYALWNVWNNSNPRDRG